MQFVKRLLDPAKRRQQKESKMSMRRRVAGAELNRMAEAFLRLFPVPIAREGHPKGIMRLGQERVQLDRLLGCGSHSRQLIVAGVPPVLTRSDNIRGGEARIGGRKGAVFGDHFL